jgi:hypothetical protein
MAPLKGPVVSLDHDICIGAAGPGRPLKETSPMLRSFRLVLFGLALVALTGSSARSQYYYPGGYGYGGWGFGGWGGTAEGSILRGMGAYAEAAGVYNYDSAVAGSINTDSYMRLNNYLYLSELEAQRRYAAHHAAKMNLDNAHYRAYQSRLLQSPTKEDIDSGSALNALLNQLTDPRVISGSGSSLRMADAKIPAASIKEIPFRDETDAITISLDQLTDPKSWPAPLRSDDFQAEREAYQKAVDDALAEDKDGGTLKSETVAKVRNAVSNLYAKVDQTIPKTRQPDHLQAMNYLKGLAGLSKMLERPNVEAALSELEKIENTTTGNLIAFMHAYNLRFDAAKTPKQVNVYRDLYPAMIAARDKIVGKPTDANNNAAPAPVENPTAVFHGFDPNHLHPKTPASNTAPAPPAPANPNPNAPKS